MILKLVEVCLGAKGFVSLLTLLYQGQLLPVFYLAKKRVLGKSSIISHLVLTKKGDVACSLPHLTYRILVLS